METETLPILNNATFGGPNIRKGFFEESIDMVGQYRQYNKMAELPKKTPYTIVPITSKDKDRVVTFLRKFFFRDEPLNVDIGLLDGNNATCAELEEYCIKCIPEGLSIMAVSPSGYLLGVCLNGVLTRTVEENEDTDSHINDCTNPKFKKILQFLTTLNKRSRVFAQYPTVDKVLDIVILSVDESYRGQGICKALIQRTRELAMEHNFPLIKVDCTSHFSAKAVSRLGFHCIFTLPFAEYVDSEGEQTFKPKAPHSSATTYVLPLSV